MHDSGGLSAVIFMLGCLWFADWRTKVNARKDRARTLGRLAQSGAVRRADDPRRER